MTANLATEKEQEIDKLLLSYSVFQLTYRNDPVSFVLDCLAFPKGEQPSAYQLECLEGIAQASRFAVRAPRGSGKTAIAAWLVHWWALTRDGRTDWKVILTASNHRQLERYLLPEVHKWSRHIRWGKVGRPSYDLRDELQLRLLRLQTGEAAPIASNNPDTMEGAHASELLVIFDEAKIIPPDTWQSMEGAFSRGEGKWLAISTPGPPIGTFYDIHSHKPGREGWGTRHISLTEAVEAGRVSGEWADTLRTTYGEDSPVYRSYALAEFADYDGNAIIPLAWVEQAQERWADWEARGRTHLNGQPSKVTGIAFDVGGDTGSSDASVIAVIYDHTKVGELIHVGKAADPSVATMELVGRIQGLWTRYAPQWVIGDPIGIGTGCVQRLRELGVPCLGYNAAASTTLRDESGELGYRNWRAAGWYTLSSLLDPRAGYDICLPDNDMLTGDLTAARPKALVSTGLRQVEEKAEMRKRLSRSPDCADAVIHGLVGPILFMAAQDANGGGRAIYDPIHMGQM